MGTSQKTVSLIISRLLKTTIFYVARTVHFEMKLYNNQPNAQDFKFSSLFASALHVSGVLYAHLQEALCTNLAVVLVGWAWCQRPSQARALTPYSGD
jgi:hypothetical protein